jgi:hypothetical protein
VGVVIHDEDATGLADAFEASPGATEARDTPGNGFEGHIEVEADRCCGERIADEVFARD